MSKTLELDPETFRRLGYEAIDLIAAALAQRSQREELARRPVPDQLRQQLMHQPMPEEGTNPDELLQFVAENIFPYPLGHNNPRFFAWINSPGAPLSVIGELLAAGMNTSAAGGDQASTYLEHGVLDWFKEMMGFPPDSGGLLVSGGSMAAIVGLAVMRHVKTNGAARREGLQQTTAPLIIYASAEGHSSIQKAIELLGFGNNNLRQVPITTDFQLDVAALAALISADRAAGRQPVCVVASAGTVNTGTIDPLNEIADLCEAEGLWFHIDGAYGAVARLLPELANQFAGLERADSLGMDPHKWMYVPVECGLVLVRDKAAMQDCFSLVPAYLRDDRLLPWFAEFGPQQTRAFRALKLWLALKQIGLSGYRELISRDIALARTLRQKIQARADFELLTSGPLSVTCFRYAPAGLTDPAAIESLNHDLLARVQAAGEVYLTHTMINGEAVLRASIVNFRTEEADLDFLLNRLAAAGQACLANPA